MKYKLPQVDLSKYGERYSGKNKRYATATDAAFVDDSKILVGSFLGKKLYLIKLGNNIEILDEIKTEGFIDIIDFKDGLIVSTNFPSHGVKNGSVSVYNLIDDKIVHIKEIILEGYKTHGCCIVDKENIIITNTYNEKRGIYFLNLETEELRKFDNFEFYPKDVFVSGNNLLICASSSGPSLRQSEIQKSKLYLFEFPSMMKKDEVNFDSQTDAVCLNGENGFLTLHQFNSILHFTLLDDKLEIKKTIEGFNFPHGVASKNNTVIVTNYGDNSIDILDLKEIIK